MKEQQKRKNEKRQKEKIGHSYTESMQINFLTFALLILVL